MNINIKIKRVTYPKSFKPDPNTMIRNLRFGSGEGRQWGYADEAGNVIGFHFEKHNRKVIATKKITKFHNGQNVMTTRYKYEPAKWIVSYYKIPVALLLVAGLRLKQGTRSFELIKK